MPKCRARASVSLNIPKLKANGSGEAYHNWNKAQALAPQKRTAPAIPPTLRPPRSTSATSCSRLAFAACRASVDGGDVVLMLDSLLCFHQVPNAPDTAPGWSYLYGRLMAARFNVASRPMSLQTGTRV